MATEYSLLDKWLAIELRILGRSIAYAGLLVLGACGFVPEQVSWSDNRMKPLHEAIHKRGDRQTIGFTPIEMSADVRLEGARTGAYDAMLHICGQTTRTIAFRKTTAGYEWIHEQEIHRGPLLFDTPDGQLAEQITLTFEIAPTSGVEPGRLTISYMGPRTDLSSRYELKYSDVAKYIADWHKAGIRVCDG